MALNEIKVDLTDIKSISKTISELCIKKYGLELEITRQENRLLNIIGNTLDYLDTIKTTKEVTQNDIQR